MKKVAWVAAGVLSAFLLLMLAPVGGQAADKSTSRIQLLVDGREVGFFTEVSGIGSETEVVAEICPIGGGDCDDTAGIAWEAATRKALWDLTAAADAAGQETWLSSKARHDTAKNAIGNIRARVADVEGALNSLSHSEAERLAAVQRGSAAVRALLLVLQSAVEPDRSPLKELEAAIDVLDRQGSGYRVKYRPGRPVFGNITLRGDLGATGSPVLAEWLKKAQGGTVDRKSGSIIYLDREGNEVLRYNFFEAWPVKHSATQIVEELEFAVERVERK